MTDLTKTADVLITPGQLLVTLARLVKTDGTLMSVSDLSSVTMQVFADDDPTTAIALNDVGATSIAVATSTATATLSLDASWDADATGYNFSHSYNPGTYLKGGKRYRMEYKITTSSLGVLYLIVNIGVRRVSSA